MKDRRAHLVLAAALVAIGLGLLFSVRASANCNEMPCTTQATPPPTTIPPRGTQRSTPQSSPQTTQQSSSQTTQAPVNRSPATTARHTTATRAPVVSQTPVTQPADQSFADAAASVSPAPALDVSGTAPPLGGGVASSSGQSDTSSSGASTVLWAFGIGIGAVGIALGARTALAGGGPPPSQPLQTA